ncbi:S8 family serine peptidase [uncultured Chryseobacterium sp.]|uniref:S8 family serine peptidase n=1 Tax=uncultured Chryseobacterium sp. TaxID=259322 RepID=UPI002621D2A2|nr:S8 family serine peptidase [uncultured Chryseobacterium sp.]
MTREDKAAQIRIQNYLQLHPEVSKVSYIGKDNGIMVELMDINPNGELIYAKTHNQGAATTARTNTLYSGGSLGINIQGQNMIAGEWDGGSARFTHQEFLVNGFSKINVLDGSPSANHATHVAGTIAAQGINPLVRGVAFNSSINSYDWNSDLAEMQTQAEGGLLTSNHSYGIGVLSAQWFYGAYDNRARQIDVMCYNNPFYLPVFSAGNDRNETTPPGSTQISIKGGYDMIFGHGNAKNIITVAAIKEVTSYTGPSSVQMSSFSSWGPTDDGRIKPDISMKGVSVRSTLNTSDTAIGNMDGTSMASPGITGVVLLLQQYHNQLYTAYMKAATAKGLILHTADEAGADIGPDYSFGWGLVNAQKAAIAIRDKNAIFGTKSIIEELTLTNGGTYTKTVTASGSAPLKVSISWTDPASPNSNNGTNDPSTVYLVNDLDVKVVQNDTTFYPWKLQGMASPFSPATNNSTNDVDNFERVDVDNPIGTYTIIVTHKGTLTGGSQNFTLIATADSLGTLGVNETNTKTTTVSIYPNPAKDFLNIQDNDIKGVSIKIFDMTGRLVLNTDPKDSKIDISKLTRGNYVGTYRNTKGELKSFKFIKE